MNLIIFVNNFFCILSRISLKYVPKGPIDNKSVIAELGVEEAITWISADPVHCWRIYVVLGEDELIMFMFLFSNRDNPKRNNENDDKSKWILSTRGVYQQGTICWPSWISGNRGL